mgnify:CR=1 FL=1
MTLKKIVAVVCLTLCLVSSMASSVQGLEPAWPDGTVTIGTREMAGRPGIYELLINQQVVLRYRSAVNGYSAAERARIIMERIKDFGSDLLTQPLRTGMLNGSAVILLGDKLLITVTQADYEANFTTGPGLAEVWRNNLANALHKNFSALIPEQPGTVPGMEPEEEQPENNNNNVTVNASQAELQMLELVNAERLSRGLKALQLDPELVKIARLKSRDMIDNNYFEHTSPTYGDPFNMMRSFGISYKYAGENLAGNPSVEDAHESLMNSPGHRANILNPNYTHIGIGIVEGGMYGKMFTQLFIGK